MPIESRVRPGHHRKLDSWRSTLASPSLSSSERTSTQGIPERRDALVVLVGEEARGRPALQQVGSFRGRETVAEPQRACVVRGCLAVRAQCARSQGRRGCVREDGLGVAGGLGVVGQPGEVGVAGRRVGERGQGEPVQRHPPVRGDRTPRSRAGPARAES